MQAAQASQSHIRLDACQSFERGLRGALERISSHGSRMLRYI
jgi:hypothetical protein